jgi:ribosome-binding protein aMBF1 (putative translation factor)
MVKPKTAQERQRYGVMIKNARKKLKLSPGNVSSKMGLPSWVIDRIESGAPIVWHESKYRMLEEILGVEPTEEVKALPGRNSTSYLSSSEPS